MRRPGDVVHWVITGHWPRWGRRLFTHRNRPCRVCGLYQIFEPPNRKAQP